MTMLAYSGAVLNTVGIYRSGSFVAGTFLIVWGGGHGDYAGNEVYALGPLTSGTPTWSRITDPTIPGISNVARSGGYPVSRHTYDCIGYLPGTNQMISGGCGGAYVAAGNFNVTDLFNFATNPTSNPWTTADTGSPAFNTAGSAGAQDAIGGVDDVTGAFWLMGQGNVQKIGRYLSGTWTSWDIDNPDSPTNIKAAVAGSISVMAFTTSAGAARAVDLRSTPSIYTPSTTGTGPGEKLTIEWDIAGSRFVGRAPTGGKTVWFLTPSGSPYGGGTAWVWSSTTPAGGVTPPDEDGAGTFGRLRVLSLPGGSRGLLYVPGPVNDAHFYRVA
jgi:hypothetical protein